MFTRPHFKDYIMAKSIAIAVAFILVFSILFLYFIPHKNDAFIAISLLTLGFSFFIFFIYRGAKKIQKELSTINKYLKNLEHIINMIKYQRISIKINDMLEATTEKHIS